MGNHLAKPSNRTMVDRLVEHHSYIHSPNVEGAFRAVDRAMYFSLENDEDVSPYDDDPWRRGNLHLSAPCIYAKVVEALDLRPGLSFLNLGSGTGYLNTIVGLLLGSNGINHGIEIHADVVEYANKRLQTFKQKSLAIDKFDFAEPIFVTGNCLNLNPDSRYDRIYLGAACLPEAENFMKKLIKPNGGILVMPYEQQLMRHIRLGEQLWITEKLMDVNFTLMVGRNNDILSNDDETIIDMPKPEAKSLKALCRIVIRQRLRAKIEQLDPNLLNSDNALSRRMCKAKLEQEILRRKQEIEILKKDLTKSRKMCLDQIKIWDLTREPVSPRWEVLRVNKLSSGLVGLNSGGTMRTASARTRAAARLVRQRIEATIAAGRAARGLNPNPQNLGRNAQSARRESNNRDNNRRSNRRNRSGVRPDRVIDKARSGRNGSGNSIGGVDNQNATRANARARLRQDCARTRPYVHFVRSRSCHTSSKLFEPGSFEDYSSSSSSSSEEESDIQNIEDFDYIRRRVLMNWPGLLRSKEPRVQFSGTGPSSSDSNMSDSSNYMEDDLSDSVSDHFDWDSGDSYASEFDQEEEEGDSSDNDYINAFGDEIDDDDDEDHGLPRQRTVFGRFGKVTCLEPSRRMAPSTSSNEARRSGALGTSTSSSSEQQPVASRLRSRRSNPEDELLTASTSGQGTSKETSSNETRSGSDRSRYYIHSNRRRHGHCRLRQPDQVADSRERRMGHCESKRNRQLENFEQEPVVIKTSAGATLSVSTCPPKSKESASSSQTATESNSIESNDTKRKTRQASHGNDTNLQNTGSSDRKRKRQSSSESLDSHSDTISRPTTSRLRSHSQYSDLRSLQSTRDNEIPSQSIANLGQKRVSDTACDKIDDPQTSSSSRDMRTPNPSSVHRVNDLQELDDHRLDYLSLVNAIRPTYRHRVDSYVSGTANNNDEALESSSSSRYQASSGLNQSENSLELAPSINELIRLQTKRYQALRNSQQVQLRSRFSVYDYSNGIQRLRDIEKLHRRAQRLAKQSYLIKKLTRERNNMSKREEECKQYNKQITDYINQLSLPIVLHDYLNYDRTMKSL